MDMNSKIPQAETVVVGPDGVKAVIDLVRLMRMDGNPPDVGCTCTSCLTKTVLVGLYVMDRAKFDEASKSIMQRAGDWAGMTKRDMEESIAKFFTEYLQPMMRAALEAKFGPLPTDSKIHIGGVPEEEIPPINEEAVMGFLMKEAKA